MVPVCLESLAEVFAQVPDPHQARGVCHPVQGMLALVFFGLLLRNVGYYAYCKGKQ